MEWNIVLLNVLYAVLGVILMYLSFRAIDALSPRIDFEEAAARAYDPRRWLSIEVVAPDVPRWRHRETLTYLGRIRSNLARMDAHGRLARRR